MRASVRTSCWFWIASSIATTRTLSWSFALAAAATTYSPTAVAATTGLQSGTDNGGGSSNSTVLGPLFAASAAFYNPVEHAVWIVGSSSRQTTTTNGTTTATTEQGSFLATAALPGSEQPISNATQPDYDQNTTHSTEMAWNHRRQHLFAPTTSSSSSSSSSTACTAVHWLSESNTAVVAGHSVDETVYSNTNNRPTATIYSPPYGLLLAEQ